MEQKTCRHKVLAGVRQICGLRSSMLEMDWFCAPSFKLQANLLNDIGIEHMCMFLPLTHNIPQMMHRSTQ